MKLNPKVAVIGLKGLPAFGGAAAVGENIINHLKDKYDFTVYATSSHADKNVRLTGFKQIVFKALSFKKLNAFYYYVVSALHAVFFKNYDLIHLHHRDAAFIIPFLKLRYKTILTIHGFGTSDLSDKWNEFRWFFEIQERFFVKFSDEIISVSKSEKALIKLKSNKTVSYVPNGVYLNNMTKIKEDYLMFAAGRIVSFKRCDIFLSALNKINYKGKILIAGDLEQSAAYKQTILDLSKNLNVVFLGLVLDKNTLMEYYSKASLFIFPSSREAMSMVLLEAASTGTPIICSDILSNRDLFLSDEVLFFETDNVSDLASKIKWATANNDLMQVKAQKALNKIAVNHQWHDIASSYDKLYKSLIGLFI